MWNGLLSSYYQARWALYGQMALDTVEPAAAGGLWFHTQFPNLTAWAIAENNLTDSWAHKVDISTDAFPTSPSGDAFELSQAAYTKFSLILLRPPPPFPAPAPPSNSSTPPVGYAKHIGEYWKHGMKHGGMAHTVTTCAAVCSRANTSCVAFELSGTRSCYIFSSLVGTFIVNPQCRTFVKFHNATAGSDSALAGRASQ